jgi:hypothetical protein
LSGEHVRKHGLHKGWGPALWVAGVVLALLIGSLVAIVLLLHQLAQLALEVAGYIGPR